jgi:hypothetical protein
MISFDESQVKEMEFKLVPEDDYIVQVVKGEAKVSSAGNDMIALELKIIKSESGDEGNQGSKLFDNIVTGNDFTMTKVASIRRSTGCKAVEINENTFVGLVGCVKVKHEEYKGETKARVHYWKDSKVEKPTVEAPAMDAESLDEDIPF